MANGPNILPLVETIRDITARRNDMMRRVQDVDIKRDQMQDANVWKGRELAMRERAFEAELVQSEQARQAKLAESARDYAYQKEKLAVDKAKLAEAARANRAKEQ